MKNGTGLAMGIITVAAVAAGGGYWLGNRGSTHVPDNTPAPAAASSPAGDTSTKERKLLHYRNPMGLPDTSPTPKKDPMGMDYIAVYAGGDEGGPATAGQVRISTEKVQKLGVRTEAARLRTLDQTVRAAGRIEADERRIYGISPKFEGYVERLHVNVTGQAVIKGQPLFEVYSPELVSAQREYAIAVQGVAALKEAGGPALAGMQQLAESSLQRLRNWDISDEQIKALAGSGEAKRTLTFRSTVSGIVTEKKAQQGNRFMPGEVLYQVADLSSVWVIAEVFEQDIGLVKSGAQAQVRINAYPGQSFGGKITYVYPTLKAETRTVPVRVELANPGLLLKPGMFAQVEVSVSGKGAVITVPVSAVIDSGTRQLVLVQQGEGRFEPRAVLLGARSDTHVEVIEGLKDGEEVVVAANFLIDAESNLKAAVGGFSSTPPTSASTAAPATPARTEAPAGPGPKRSPGSGHRAEGTVDSVDAKAGTISLTHGPVASLKWPAMTMEFKAANASLLPALKPGAKVSFEFIERQPGEWVITSVKPMEAR
jgi:Cu(I)/Ag(I) efflux system membrane fusion protein